MSTAKVLMVVLVVVLTVVAIVARLVVTGRGSSFTSDARTGESWGGDRRDP